MNWLKEKLAKMSARLRGHSGQVPVPDFWQEYLDCFEHSCPPATPLENLRFVVLDTETTGLNPRQDRILAIGAVVVKNWSIYVEESFECFIHQDYEPARSSVEVHGILPVEREGSLSEKEALHRLLVFLKDGILVGHHIGFDVAMINAALGINGGKKLKNRIVDTLQLARRLQPSTYFHQEGAYSLDQLCNQHGIPLADRHTAAGDAFLTALLLLKQLGRLQERGVKTLEGLLRKPLI